MSDNSAAKRVINTPALRDKTFKRIGFQPHPAQNMIVKSKARHKVAGCGRRFGKSYVGGHELTVEAMKTRILLPQLEAADRRREFWIVGPNYTDAEKEFRAHYNDLKRLGAPFDHPGTYNNPHDGDMQVSLYGGKFIVIGKSAQYPERLVGEGINGVIMAEAAKMKEQVWTKFIRPMLADFPGWSLHTSTPEGRNWFYEAWMRGQSEDEPDWESWRMPSWLNPYVYPGKTNAKHIELLQDLIRDKQTLTPDLLAALTIDPEILALARDLTPETFNQEIAAKFSEFVGRVFKDFDEETHVKRLTYDPALPTFAACDYGFTNPFVWLLIQMDHTGSVYVLDEMYEPGLTIDEAIVELRIRNLVPQTVHKFYPDPASPGDTKAIEKAFRIKGQSGTGGELNTRIRMIRAALKVRHLELEPGHPDRVPKLFFDPKCVNGIREMSSWRYPKTASEAKQNDTNLPEKPMKKDDHVPEALGRFYAGQFNTPERAGAKVRDATYA
jgi:hypothetical protein